MVLKDSVSANSTHSPSMSANDTDLKGFAESATYSAMGAVANINDAPTGAVSKGGM